MSSEELEDGLFELILPKKITEFETSQIVDVPIEKIFNVMADVENFPNVIPKNILGVNILNKTSTVVIAEEEFSEVGIKTKLLVKHTITPHSKHVIEIIDGDAQGTIITQSFESLGSQTKLHTHVNLNVKGVMSIVSFFPESNLIHALNTVTTHFVEYSKLDPYEISVNTIYQETLHRTADKEGLLYYSELLKNKQITEDELRNILSTSDEASSKIKTIDELDETTKTVINNLYQKILLRDADFEGLKYFGNLLETGVSYEEIRDILLDSDEAATISLTHLERSKIITTYRLLFDKFPEKSEVDHFYKIHDDGNRLAPNWIINIFIWRQDVMISEEEASNVIRYLYNDGLVLIDEIPSKDKPLEYKNLEK